MDALELRPTLPHRGIRHGTGERSSRLSLEDPNVRYCSIAVIAIFALACGQDDRTTSDSTAAPPPTSSAGDSAAPSGTSPSAPGWTVTPAGIGAVRVGMSVDELERAGGDFTAPAGSAGCAYVRPASLPIGTSVMLANGRVARIDVDSAGVRTDAGISVGDSSSAVLRAYAGRVTTMPHKYVPGGEYLTVRSVSPTDSTLRIVFESEAGRVTRYRSGRVPEVEWVERCG